MSESVEMSGPSRTLGERLACFRVSTVTRYIRNLKVGLGLDKQLSTRKASATYPETRAQV